MIAVGGQEMLRSFAKEGAALVVLDLAMPLPDGCEVCRRTRETSRVPILMLAGGDDVANTVRALDSGAYDCLVRPYSWFALAARLRALLRRAPVDGE
jgi:two-component system response regulator MprA